MARTEGTGEPLVVPVVEEQVAFDERTVERFPLRPSR